MTGARPEAFSAAARAWGRSGWTEVELANVALGELGELMFEAWRLMAPKALVDDLDGGRKKRRTAR